jgi:hypothetical protein
MEPEKLSTAEESALILITNLPEDYVSSREKDRMTIARMYEQLYGRPLQGGAEPW